SPNMGGMELMIRHGHKQEQRKKWRGWVERRYNIMV
ncbi:MAG: hypothetical protein ACI90V_011910, partial [Bacillariaceae sp.]